MYTCIILIFIYRYDIWSSIIRGRINSRTSIRNCCASKAAIEGLASICVAVCAGCELQYIKSKMGDDLYKLEEASKGTSISKVKVDRDTLIKKESKKPHIFSKKHLDGGIMKLGNSKEEIMNL